MDKAQILARFCKYVQIDTQSDPSSGAQPSTAKQLNLSQILVNELLDMGVEDAILDEYGYVYATVKSNISQTVPNICFCSHVDTSPDCSGAGVKPLVHQNYQGQDLVLPDDPTVVIKMVNHPDLKNQIGNDIITASGTTLLGADNKAGITAIMTAVSYLIQNNEIPRGNIRILFTPDEEIGRGTAKVDMQKLNARYGYTVDGESLGTIENETFSANGMKIKIFGISAHPGFAKGKMESAIKIAGEIIANIPQSLSPEHTEGMEGFMHPVQLTGHVEAAEIDLIIRDFEEDGLETLQQVMNSIVDEVMVNYPNSRYDIEITEQYRNMKSVLEDHPQIVTIAEKAMLMAGLQPQLRSIRGGTDGSRLSFMGMPTANIFAGEHAFHSKEEWVSVQDIAKAAETIVNIAQIWAQEKNV